MVIRLPLELRNDIRKYLGGTKKISEIIRNVLSERIKIQKDNLEPMLHCRVCDSKKESLKDVYLTSPMKIDEEFSVWYLICRDCFDNLIKEKPSKWEEIEKKEKRQLTHREYDTFMIYFMITGLKKDDKGNRKINENHIAFVKQTNEEHEFLDMMIRLLKYYPLSYEFGRYNGTIVEKSCSKEEFSKRLDTIYNSPK